MALWEPQPGPQTYAATCPADVIFFGGMRGGGKSDCMIGRQIRGAEVWNEAWNGLIVRRKYKDFAEIRRRIDELIRAGMPAERIGGDNQTNYVKFQNGAKITLAAIQELKQVDDFLGHQYTEISIDEAPSIYFIAQLIDKLKGCLRSPHGVPCHMFLSGNPGGPGSNTIKLMYVKKARPMVPFRDADGMSAIFIPSSLADNKILCDKDPAYVNRLRSIKDPALRAAWLLGDWDAFVGQAFEFSREYHVIPRQHPPDRSQIYMTYDFGFAAPFSVGWWFIDYAGRCIRFAEWYGWDGETPNVGRRMTDSQVAQGIVDRERKLGINPDRVFRLASHDCWNKKPDYKGGGQGPSTAETWATEPFKLYLTKADPSRLLKIRQFRERLLVHFKNLENVARRLGLEHYEHEILGEVWKNKAGQFLDDRKLVELAKSHSIQLEWDPPMLLVTENCEHFIRTIPDLCIDETQIEDVDTDQEDHVYDEACQICMARPLAPERPKKLKTPSQIHIEQIERRAPEEDEYMIREAAQELAYYDDEDRPVREMHYDLEDR